MEGKGHKYVTSGSAAFSVRLPVRTGVYAMDARNWSNLNGGRSFRYVDGGLATRTPAVVRVPHAGTWYIVVEAVPGRAISYEITPI
jgi:hypothetical protein